MIELNNWLARAMGYSLDSRAAFSGRFAARAHNVSSESNRPDHIHWLKSSIAFARPLVTAFLALLLLTARAGQSLFLVSQHLSLFTYARSSICTRCFVSFCIETKEKEGRFGCVMSV